MIKTQININKNQNQKSKENKLRATHFELEKSRDGGDTWWF